MWWTPWSFIPSILPYRRCFHPPAPGQITDMKLVFIPISIVGGLLAGAIGQKAFDAIWGKVDDREPPQPEHRDTTLPKLAIVLVIEGSIFRLVKDHFDHVARREFARITW